MIGKPKVMICIGMICLGAFLIHSSDARAAELRESEVEEELREDEDADTEIVFDADTAINRTAAKSALADLHGVFVFRDAFIRQEQIVKSQQKQNYKKMEQIVLTKQQPDSGYEELVDLVLNSDDTKYIKDMYYMEESHEAFLWVLCIVTSVCGLCIAIWIQDYRKKQNSDKRNR